MGKKKHKKHSSNHDGHDEHVTTEPMTTEPMKNKEFRKLVKPLHVELVAMQEWVRTTGAKVCIVFEGRDTAGKGGVIKSITERVSPRVFRVVALPAPTEREKSQMYIQRYVPHLPAAGEVVIFDRSWYNRAGVERVMGFCTEEQTKQFLTEAPEYERSIVASGVILLKYWLEVSEGQQTLRLQSRIDDPRKYWKLSPMDLKSYTRWDDYTRARDDMFRFTDTGWAPCTSRTPTTRNAVVSTSSATSSTRFPTPRSTAPTWNSPSGRRPVTRDPTCRSGASPRCIDLSS